MSDLRRGVSEPVQRVLDLLDKARASWAQLSEEDLQAEITIEATGIDASALMAVLDGAGASEAWRVAACGQSATRLAALVLFRIERAAEAADTSKGEAE